MGGEKPLVCELQRLAAGFHGATLSSLDILLRELKGCLRAVLQEGCVCPPPPEAKAVYYHANNKKPAEAGCLPSKLSNILFTRTPSIDRSLRKI